MLPAEMTNRSEDAHTEDNPQLVSEIRAAIAAAGGRITFRQFMELALYQPRLGYYHAAGEKTGRGGDFITSPGVSPLFARTIGRYFGELFSGGLPARAVELGAGDGSLASQLASVADYTIVERSLDFQARQRERLGNRVSWAEAVPTGLEGIVFSNELLDALPVHRVDRERELYVRWNGSGFAGELDNYSTVRLRDYFERLGLKPAGQAEVNLDAVDLMTEVYSHVARGVVLTIDYGYTAEELFLRHPQGTFLTYYQHTTNDRPFEHVGAKDMTSHVDFTSLMALGESLGFRTSTFTTQAEFLIAHGIGDLLMEIQRTATDAADYFTAREAVTSLLSPRGMGGFRVLVQEKLA